MPRDRADSDDPRPPYDAALATDSAVVVYRITGAFFFGAASAVGAVLDRLADRHKAFILDFAAVPLLDSTAANAIAGIGRKAEREGVRVFLTGTAPAVRTALSIAGARPPHVEYRPTIEEAVRDAHALVAG